ncbi:hypothetical protein K440DRAFT_168918 [Wilcoxina mikolae CBS 423.85]|nr:hypothetical protein K440DRAFT_168918 [Wilcoxina mikolae CBS 423.85]
MQAVGRWNNTQAQLRDTYAWDHLRPGVTPLSSTVPTESNGIIGAFSLTRGSVNGVEGSILNRFNFTNTHRERALVKEQSQEEFDRKIEKERQGQGFHGFVDDGQR